VRFVGFVVRVQTYRRIGIALAGIITLVVTFIAAAPADAASSRPAVHLLSISSGSTSGGTKVTLSGSGFTHVASVKFGSVRGTHLHVLSSRKLQITTPRHSSGVVVVRVVTTRGTSASVRKSRFDFVAPPSVTAVSPAAGPITGRMRVTITGRSFTHVKKVIFGSTGGSSLSVKSSTKLQVTTPAHTNGSVSVRVVTSYGESKAVTVGKYNFVAPPSITAIMPIAGPVTGGTIVDITGHNFLAVTSVTFGATPGRSIESVSSTHLRVTAPAHALGAVSVVVTSKYGKSKAVVASRYEYRLPSVATVKAEAKAGGIVLTWTNPNFAGFAGVMIRRAPGAAAPTSPTDGTRIMDVGPSVVSFTDTTAVPDTKYSYALFAHNAVPNYAVGVSVTQTSVDNVPPGIPQKLTATVETNSVHLAWTNPTDADFAGVMIRRNPGASPPANPTSGTLVTLTDPKTDSYVDAGRTPNTKYAYSLFAYDEVPNYSSAATVVAVTAPVNSSGPAPVQQRTDTDVTADELPTVQIDGVVWSQAVVGNTVYAGGSFANARPAGAAPGTNLTPRSNLLAYNITTGDLIPSFAPTINGEVQVVKVSPDGSKVYIGGAFTQVNGQNRYRLAAFNVATGQLLPSFVPVVGSQVNALTVTNSTVYLGGFFNTVNGVSRTRLAAVDANTGALLAWAPTADDAVNAVQLTPDGTKVVIAGSFTKISSTTVYGLGAVDAKSGATVPYAANKTVQAFNNGSGLGAGFFSLSADTNTVYATAWNFSGGGNFEGTVATNPSDGSIRWMEDCHGDTYDTASLNGTVYTVSHAHYCQTLNGWPVYNPWQERHAVAFTADTTGTLAHNTQGGYHDFYGEPAPSLVNWYPDFVDGTYTSSKQAAWSLAGNSQYLVVGGEFPSVNSVAQQGLVRFAIPSIAPDKERPRLSGANFPLTAKSQSRGTVHLTWQANWDRDDTTLYYKVYRDGTTSTPVYTTTLNSQWWNQPAMSFTDSGLVPGSTHTYVVSVSDANGNLVYGSTASVTVSA
jgi:IPT/TIG domain